MPITLDQLAENIDPSRTVLLLGAGASVPSGAPSGAELAKDLWERIAHCEAKSEDLIDTTTILSRNYSRKVVAEAVAFILGAFQPTGGLLALPNFPWYEIFTTNFDLLVERAYKRTKVPLTVFRSNFDFTSKEEEVGTKLFKIHGCITKDSSFGDKASMTLTETDYEEHERYRQSLFSEMSTAMMSKDVLVIGQSLRDVHLKNLVKGVLAAKRDGALGHVYALVFEPDDVRAPPLEDRGVRITFGGIDELVHALASGHSGESATTYEAATGVLSPQLSSNTLEAAVEAAKTTSIVQMFNGAAATYADVAAGATFERHFDVGALSDLLDNKVNSISLVGAAGVGKTTFARQLLLGLTKKGISAWEHKSDFPLHSKDWLAVEAALREQGLLGALLIDECTHFMRDVNALLETLSGMLRSQILDRRRLEFPAYVAMAGLGVPLRRTNEIGVFCPIAPCGRCSL